MLLGSKADWVVILRIYDGQVTKDHNFSQPSCYLLNKGIKQCQGLKLN